MENNTYEIAFAEVYEIFKIMDENDLKKIPDTFKKFIEENKAKDYTPIMDKNIPLYKQDLKQETFAICALIYRDYLVSPEKRKEIEEKDKEEISKIEKEIREKYNPDEIFKNETIEINKEDTKIISCKDEKILIKVFRKICQIFKKEK